MAGDDGAFSPAAVAGGTAGPTRRRGAPPTKTAIAAATLGLLLAGAAHADQQARIAAGVRSGQLTPHEARRLERQQGRIDRTERRERHAQAGALTPHQRARLQHREDRANAAIWRAKHNNHVA